MYCSSAAFFWKKEEKEKKNFSRVTSIACVFYVSVVLYNNMNSKRTDLIHSSH